MKDEPEFNSPVEWPDGFLDLCQQERLGMIPIDLQSMKSESGDDPNHTFPLRDVESQFKVELKQGPEQRSLGSLSYGQLLREAYPGAVYYYITHPYRVRNVYPNTKTVQVRKEKRYTTKPQMLPTQVFPNLGAGNVFQGRRYGELVVVECALQVREAVSGFKERRGPNEFLCTYPLDATKTGIYFKMPRFTRNYFTTGIMLSHPALNEKKVRCDALASLLYEAFLMCIPFERQDLYYADDRFKVQQGPVSEGSAFLTIYDQTYGSLRLSGRLLGHDILCQTFEQAAILADQQMLLAEAETREALQAMALAVTSTPPIELSFEIDALPPASGTTIEVIMPESKGLDRHRNNEEFAVEAVFFHPSIGGLSYRGRRLSNGDDTAKDIVPLDALIPIPGESKMGRYDYDTGEITPG